MQISLSKNSDVPLRRQLAEQVVFLITTGQLRAGENLPSVRALARRLKVHHNTVSGAYKDLVQRNWVTRQRGSKLVVGVRLPSTTGSPASLDQLINDTIQRARALGFSLQALTDCVRERLQAQPADHILIVEEELGLREIIGAEVRSALGWRVELCSLEEVKTRSGVVVGAQVFAPAHILVELQPFIPENRPAISISYSQASEHLAAIRALSKPSAIAVVSVSKSVLRTARGLLAPAIGRKHTFREILITGKVRADTGQYDVVFCDSIAFLSTRNKRKIRYQLVADSCMEHLSAAIKSTSNGVTNSKQK
jgi:DNA-binding transcriptional regulator YhcF (GntR family)